MGKAENLIQEILASEYVKQYQAEGAIKQLDTTIAQLMREKRERAKELQRIDTTIAQYETQLKENE